VERQFTEFFLGFFVAYTVAVCYYALNYL